MIETRRFVSFFFFIATRIFQRLSFAIIVSMLSRRSFRCAIFPITPDKISIGINLRESSKVYLSKPDRWQFANGTLYLAGLSDARMHVSALYRSPRLECMHLSLAEVNTAERQTRESDPGHHSFVTDDRFVQAKASRNVRLNCRCIANWRAIINWFIADSHQIFCNLF